MLREKLILRDAGELKRRSCTQDQRMTASFGAIAAPLKVVKLLFLLSPVPLALLLASKARRRAPSPPLKKIFAAKPKLTCNTLHYKF